MNMSVGLIEPSESQQRTLHWEIGCPEMEGCLAEADVVAELSSGCYMPVVTIKRCSLWPEKNRCGQKCLLRNRARQLHSETSDVYLAR